MKEIAQFKSQVLSNGAANTAIHQLEDIFTAGRNKRVVEVGLAELINNHRRVSEIRALQQAGQERGFTAAQKAGDYGDWDHYYNREI